jgi:hypothetical protein
MNRLHLDPDAPEIEAFFAVEREAPAEPHDIRNRVIERARASLQHQAAVPFDSLSPSPRRLRIGMAAAAIVVVTALSATAFFAGYQTRSRSAEVPAAVGAVVPSGVSLRVPAPSVVVALVPVPTSTISPIPNSEPVVRSPRVVQAKPAGSATSATKSEAYAMELRVLQPARQAASALATVAEHQRSYPSGVLAEEREALRVRALVGLGRIAEAERAGGAFRKHFPRSALVKRIDEMLGTQQ